MQGATRLTVERAGIGVVVLIGLLMAGTGPGTAMAQEPAPREPDRFHVLVVNDDGVDAPGIAALVAELAADPSYRVTVVAPAEPQSGQGHALVYKRLAKASPHKPLSACPTWAVDVTPATTVAVALTGLLAEDPPDLVVSGINKGENIGLVAWYSGTVGAAREAALRDVPSIAFSLELEWGEQRPDFPAAARWAKPVVDAVRAWSLPPGVYLNVNLPKDPAQTKGYRIARTGSAKDEENRYQEVCTVDGDRYFKALWKPPVGDQPGTDIDGLENGWVVIVAMSLDQTAHDQLPLLEKLPIEAPAPISATGTE